MGLFSKFFQSANDAEKAEKMMRDLFGGANNNNNRSVQQQPVQQSAPAPAPQQRPASNSPSGFSWGEEMPAEENQYNFNCTYKHYFYSIFLTEFSDYQIMCNSAQYT